MRRTASISIAPWKSFWASILAAGLRKQLTENYRIADSKNQSLRSGRQLIVTMTFVIEPLAADFAGCAGFWC